MSESIWFSEVLSEEQSAAATTQDYLLRMQNGKNSVYNIEGWKGLVYHKPTANIESALVLETKIRKTRDEALTEGVVMMEQRQKEFDRAMHRK